MVRRQVTVALVLAIVALVTPAGWPTTSAVAHGPCRCLDPPVSEAGGRVRIASEAGIGQARRDVYPAYRVIFNPRPRDLGIAPSYLASAYRADVPTTTVLSRPRRRPTRRGRFRVPANTPPGVYLVLIFDGSEGGAHSTREYIHVIDPNEPDQGGVVAQRQRRPGRAAANTIRTQRDSRFRESGGWWAVLAAAVIGSAAAGVGVERWRGRRRK